MIVKEQLSKRAVVKEDGLGQCFPRGRLTQKELSESTTKSKSRHRQSLMDVLVSVHYNCTVHRVNMDLL